ncbi:MAG: transposase [Pseudomonadales bacterium]|jgi:transposase-like protein|nr:transposase [Pseudomonadales bacterium]
MKKTRKRYRPEEKVVILRRLLVEKVPISDLCDEYKIHPTMVYGWQKQFFEGGAAAFERPRGEKKKQEDSSQRKIAALEDKLQRKNEVVAELMEEHVQLKKELGEP